MSTVTYSNSLSNGLTSNAYGPTSVNDIDNAIVPMLAATRFTVENETTMVQLVRTVTLGKGGGDSYREPKMGTLEAFALTTGVDMQQAQKLQDSIWTVTPGEVGCQVILTDKVMRIVRDNQLDIAGRLMGDAVQRKVDKDGITMLTSFGTTIGSSGVALTHAYVAASVNSFEGYEEPPPRPYHYVQHSHAYHPLQKNLAPTGTYPIPDGISKEVIEKGFIMKSMAGASLWKNNNIAKSGNDASGGAFSKEAILHVKSVAPTMEKERDASLRAWEVNLVTEYGWGLYNANWGRKTTHDATTPAS